MAARRAGLWKRRRPRWAALRVVGIFAASVLVTALFATALLQLPLNAGRFVFRMAQARRTAKNT
jgi:hypothetical protein